MRWIKPELYGGGLRDGIIFSIGAGFKGQFFRHETVKIKTGGAVIFNRHTIAAPPENTRTYQ
ncbi:MAG: hypothetical protein LBG24_10825 [Treponema sp.]|jgi:hypothetical protein|nr:hypothetical protein [Treponema sp.]